ncbi:MAG: NAD-dependent epimerase/dehydratase family protein [Chloroflexi bacterium]|nr:NAD-dependent epimerase/dehydratase family protein [Chloroflexota bacterium]
MSTSVIGGAGFLGAELTRLLVESGRDVKVLGRQPEPRRQLPGAARYVSGDYGNRADLLRILDGADEVIHLAYSTVPQTSAEDPVFDIVSNLPASVQLLNHAAALAVGKLLIVSSGGTVYGKTGTEPIREDHPTNPISPYGITKLMIEKYAGMVHSTSGLHVVVVRPANVYGNTQQSHGGQGFIPAAIKAILDRNEVPVFGARGGVRDYIHVSDVARGVLAALEVGVPGGTYNIGTGTGRDNLEVLRELEPLAADAGFPVLPRILPERVFDVPYNVLDSRRLREVSGWRAEIEFAPGVAGVFAAALDAHQRPS